MGRPNFITPGSTSSGGGGGGGGGVSDQYLKFGDGTEIGSSGAVSAGSGNAINLAIADGQAAATASQGLSGLVGGYVFDLGSNITGAVNLTLAWADASAIPARIHLCLAVWRAASAPTTLQDLEDENCRFLQIVTNVSSGVSTYLKKEDRTLGTSNVENKSTSVSFEYCVMSDPKGFGGNMLRHYYTSSGTTIRQDSSIENESTGSLYAALCWGKLGIAASEDMTISVTLRGGMPL